jgi:VanZ family protein
MLPLNYHRRWRIAGIVILLAVLSFAMIPDIWPWDSRQARFIISDKVLHGFTFGFLALWYTGQYARRSYLRLAVGLIAFGVLIEVCQSLVTYRTAEWGDLWADLAGIAVGMIIALSLTGGWSLRVERWLAKRSE